MKSTRQTAGCLLLRKKYAGYCTRMGRQHHGKYFCLLYCEGRNQGRHMKSGIEYMAWLSDWFCRTATMESETEATTRSSTTVRRTAGRRSSAGSGRTAATQPPAAAAHGGRRHPTRPAPRRSGHAPLPTTSPIRTPTAAPEGPNPASTSTSDRDHPHADLDHEVGRQRPVGAVGLEQAAVERQEDEERGGGQDRRDADAALLVQQHGHAVPADEHDRRPRPARASCPAGAPGRPSAAPGGRCRPRATWSPAAPPRPPPPIRAWRG